MDERLRVYPTFYEDYRMAHISIPTSQEYHDNEVVEDLTVAADNIGCVKFEYESKKPTRFIGTTMDVIIVTFKTLADMNRYKEHIEAHYA